ncbi:MAG: BatA domain-containing protein, partial [Paracoccaceae bacterium]
MIAFTTPLLLLVLIALPVLWLLLRAVPPAPIRRRFPGVALLLGLTDEDREADKTPWWLLLLRMAAVAAAIIAFAGPVLNPRTDARGSGPLLVVVDGGWADAGDWARRVDRAVGLVEEAGRDGRLVAVVQLTDAPEAVVFQAADAWVGRVAALEPAAWLPGGLASWEGELPEGDFDTYWLADGLQHPGQEALVAALQARGQVTVVASPRPVLALYPPVFEDGAVQVRASRVPAGAAVQVEVVARGPDPSGIDRELARVVLPFAGGAAEAKASLSLPPELRNRIQRFEVLGQRSTGAVSLTDDSLKRRKVAWIGGGADREGLQLLAPTHF